MGDNTRIFLGLQLINVYTNPVFMSRISVLFFMEPVTCIDTTDRVIITADKHTNQNHYILHKLSVWNSLH